MSAMGAAHTIGSTLKVRLKSLLQEFLGLSRELLAAVASDAGEPAAARALNLGNKPRPVAEVMRAVLAKDTELSAGCEQLEVHLIFERKCSELRRQISREDKATAYLIGTLRQVEKQLTRAIDTAEPAVSRDHVAAGPLPVSDLSPVLRRPRRTARLLKIPWTSKICCTWPKMSATPCGPAQVSRRGCPCGDFCARAPYQPRCAAAG
jgi:hypothetical protein